MNEFKNIIGTVKLITLVYVIIGIIAGTVVYLL